MKKPRIEIIPMIDTIFFLLVFFMISTLSMAHYKGPQLEPDLSSAREMGAWSMEWASKEEAEEQA